MTICFVYRNLYRVLLWFATLVDYLCIMCKNVGTAHALLLPQMHVLWRAITWKDTGQVVT